MSTLRIPDGYSLVYLPHGHVAHMRYGTDMTAVCRAEAKDLYQDGGWYGTGDQDEWDRARALPLCARCFPNGPRRPEATP